MPSLPSLLAGSMLGALLLYALTAGADFGGGVWNLLARGPRADAQRRLIARAIGAVGGTRGAPFGGGQPRHPDPPGGDDRRGLLRQDPRGNARLHRGHVELARTLSSRGGGPYPFRVFLPGGRLPHPGNGGPR